MGSPRLETLGRRNGPDRSRSGGSLADEAGCPFSKDVKGLFDHHLSFLQDRSDRLPCYGAFIPPTAQGCERLSEPRPSPYDTKASLCGHSHSAPPASPIHARLSAGACDPHAPSDEPDRLPPCRSEVTGLKQSGLSHRAAAQPFAPAPSRPRAPSPPGRDMPRDQTERQAVDRSALQPSDRPVHNGPVTLSPVRSQSILVAAAPGSPKSTGRTRQLTGQTPYVRSKTPARSVHRTPSVLSLAGIHFLCLTPSVADNSGCAPALPLERIHISLDCRNTFPRQRKTRSHCVRVSKPARSGLEAGRGRTGSKALDRLGRGHRPRFTSRMTLPRRRA